MFEAADPLLRCSQGTLREHPLPLLFRALWLGRRTAALELKHQALEKVVLFVDGAPVGCTSNLVHETFGRFLVERRVLTEERHLEVLGESARRQVRFEKVLFEEKLVDLDTLHRHQHANLAQKVLDAFRWTDARWRLSSEIEIAPDAPRMNAPQLLYTAVCSVLPAETLAALFSFRPDQRFIASLPPPACFEELKLSAADARLAGAVRGGARLDALASFSGLDEDAVRRRIVALGLLGCLSEEQVGVASQPPRPAAAARAPTPRPAPLAALVAPPAPDPTLEPEAARAPSGRGPGRAVAIAAAVLLLIVAAVIGLAPRHRGESERAVAPVVFEPAPRAPPGGTPMPKAPVTPLPAAPTASQAKPAEPRPLALSASGIELRPPAAAQGRCATVSILGLRLLSTGKTAQARAALLRWATLDPKDAAAPYALALVDFVEHRDEAARQAAARALELDPGLADAHLLAGHLAQLAGDAPRAADHYRAFLASEGTSPRGQDVRWLVEQLVDAR